MKFTTRFPQLSLRLFLLAVLPCVCAGRVHAQDNLNYKGEIEFAFVNKFTNLWDDGGTLCERVSFWQPNLPAGYYKVGDYGHLTRDDPSGTAVVVVVKPLTATALADPVDFTYQWWDRRGNCVFWQPVPPAGYVAMGTVVTTNWTKPTKAGHGVVCVRKDLVVEGTVGTRIWDDHDSTASWNCTIYHIGGTTPPKGVAYFTPGTFLAQSSYDAPLSHACAYQFQIEVPAQQAQQETEPQRPTLRSFDKPGDYAEDTVKQTCLLPWFTVKDDTLTTAEKLARSPYYKLERTDRYKLIAFTNNASDSVQTTKRSYKHSTAYAHIKTFSETTGIEISSTYKVGQKILGGELSVGVKLSQNFTTGWSDTNTTTDEESKDINLTAQPGTAAAAYSIESTFRLFRDSGKGTEVVIGDTPSGTQPDVYYTVYPSAPRKQLEGPNNPVAGLEKYLRKNGGSYTRRAIPGGKSEWVVVDACVLGTVVFEEFEEAGMSRKDWILLRRPSERLVIALPTLGGVSYRAHTTKVWAANWLDDGEVSLAK